MKLQQKLIMSIKQQMAVHDSNEYDKFNKYQVMEGRDDLSAAFMSQKFSDEGDEQNDRYKKAMDMVTKGRRALKSAGGAHLTFRKNLVTKIYLLHGKVSNEVESLNPDDKIQAVILDTWTEEIIKFLALKTIVGDHAEPCQFLPGHGVGIGWKVLMMTPSLYSKVCLAMGNQNVFDHDPFDTATTSKVQEKHKVKRFNATLRAYENYFDEQPKSLYWSFYPKKQQEEGFFASMIKQCGVDISFLSDPLAMEQRTRESGMSPSMPSLM